MSPETFLILCAVYLGIVVVALLLRLVYDSRGTYEPRQPDESSRIAEDVNRMRTLADIEYYKNLQNRYKPRDKQ